MFFTTKKIQVLKVTVTSHLLSIVYHNHYNESTFQSYHSGHAHDASLYRRMSKVNITNNMFMYCSKVYKRDLVDYDQRFSLIELVLPLRELYAKCSFIFNISLIFNLLLSVAKMLGLE